MKNKKPKLLIIFSLTFLLQLSLLTPTISYAKTPIYTSEQVPIYHLTDLNNPELNELLEEANRKQIPIEAIERYYEEYNKLYNVFDKEELYKMISEDIKYCLKLTNKLENYGLKFKPIINEEEIFKNKDIFPRDSAELRYRMLLQPIFNNIMTPKENQKNNLNSKTHIDLTLEGHQKYNPIEFKKIIESANNNTLQDVKPTNLFKDYEESPQTENVESLQTENEESEGLNYLLFLLSGIVSLVALIICAVW